MGEWVIAHPIANHPITNSGSLLWRPDAQVIELAFVVAP
jgi:hypothetical protein